MRTKKRLKSDPSAIIGRGCDIIEEKEISELEFGMDFRDIRYRREVFIRFYEFHLKYKSHPGGVYFLMPAISELLELSFNQKLWFAFINGSTQNPFSSWAVFNYFPDFETLDLDEFETWHRLNWKKLQYDIDRRYVKGHLSEQVQNYRKILNGKTQEEFFNELCDSKDPYHNFWNVWNKVFNDFFLYGRLSTFSYLEYLKIMGLNIDCPDLFMDDLNGSKSHRNGMLKVLGRDDLDWHKENPEVETHCKEIVEWLEVEAGILLNECKERFKGREFFHDVNYFTLESTLCCYKSWHRVNRRYPNVYMDMMLERIRYAENAGWGGDIDFSIFYDIRSMCLPEHLLLEKNQKDPTYSGKVIKMSTEKQNHYRETGEVIMMDKEYNCFKNKFNEKYYG